MAEIEYAVDDRPRKTPEWMKKMTREEIDEEIAYFEAIGRADRERLNQFRAEKGRDLTLEERKAEYRRMLEFDRREEERMRLKYGGRP